MRSDIARPRSCLSWEFMDLLVAALDMIGSLPPTIGDLLPVIGDLHPTIDQPAIGLEEVPVIVEGCGGGGGSGGDGGHVRVPGGAVNVGAEVATRIVLQGRDEVRTPASKRGCTEPTTKA